MSYSEAYARAWKDGGPQAALDLLRGIFHDPENQALPGKPTDYLHDDDDEESPDPRKKPASVGFDQMMRLFSPKEDQATRVDFIAECLVESRSEEADLIHRAQPFNGLVLVLSTYDHGSAVLDSIHLDPGGGEPRRQYGLNHEIVRAEDNYDPETDDDEDSYAFIGGLGDRSLRYQGEAVPGRTLFRDIRLAQYAIYAGELIEALIDREAFADFPKQLPFQFLAVPREDFRGGGPLSLDYPFHPALTAESLAERRLGPRHLASAKPLVPLSPEEEWLHYLRYLDEDEAAERKKLVGLLQKNPSLLEATVELAERALLLQHRQRTGDESKLPAAQGLLKKVRRLSNPNAYLRLLFEVRPEAGSRYYLKMLDLPLPSLPHQEIEEAIDLAQATVDGLYGAFALVPAAERAALEPAFAAACARLQSVEHPVMKLLAMEAELSRVHGPEWINGEGEDEVEYSLDPIPENYVDAVAACIPEMPESFEWYGAKFSFVTGRLAGLGASATRIGPQVVELMNRYCTELQDGGQALERFAHILYAMKLEEPPPLIRSYCEEKDYHGVDFYKEWAQNVPERRTQALWQALAASPAQFEEPARWEAHLYDSALGLEVAKKGLSAQPDPEDILRRLCAALKKGPGPVLTRFAYALAGDELPDTVEEARASLRILDALPSLDPEHQALAEKCRVLMVRAAMDQRDPQAAALLEAQGLGQPTLRLFKAELEEERAGAAAAAALTLEAVQALSAEDHVYRKAFFQLLEQDPPRWEAVKPADAYAIYRLTLDRYRDQNYREAQFRIRDNGLSGDPFYAGLVYAYELPGAEAQALLAEARADFEVVDALRRAPLPELEALLDKNYFGRCRQIVRRWMRESEVYGARILKVYDWFRSDKDRRLALLKEIWPVQAFRPTLLLHPKFQQDLPWFFDKYPLGTVELVKECFGILNDRQQFAAVASTAKKLSGELITATFLSIDRAIRGLADPKLGVEILEEVAKKVNPKKPEVVLINSNLAVMHMQAKDPRAAEAVFDRLFQMDFSRFDYQPGEDDDMMSEILGGDLDAQIAAAFRQYYASAKYNAACLYALTERPELAVAALREALAKHPGPYDQKKLAGERDFDAIRRHADFVALVAEIEGAKR
ncbi:MAG: hypothetical protein U1E65_16690 [Myxococcota bacterium]